LLEQYFNAEITTWALTFASVGLISNLIYISWNIALQYFLEWEQIEGTSSSDKLKRKMRSLLLVNTLISQNYWLVLIQYCFIDSSMIFPTGFELIIFLIVFSYQSYVLSSMKIVEKFIAEVIDAQISFTTTITL